ncbi:MAG: AI-2E family transporter [Anaerolineae bacterium]|nr:AI-2E family transporter [Anaerolineae bacterium]
MTQTPNPKDTAVDGISPGLRRWGTRSWLYLGIFLFIMAIVSFLSAISGLFVPLVVAVVVAMICYPLVDFMAAHGLNRALGSVLVILLVMAVCIGIAWLTVVGIYSQTDEMVAELTAGLTTLATMLNLELPAETIEAIRTKAVAALAGLAYGLTSFIFSSFSGIVGLFMGVFTAFFLLFYLLADWHGITAWVGCHMGLPAELGTTVLAKATEAMRIYFYAVTLSNLPVAVAVGGAMWLMGLPLAMPVAVITMATAYIPYLGAIISGAFAALVALGAGGLTEALIILAVIVLMQNIIGPILAVYVASDKLQMNPIVTLLTTLGGGILFGALGATMAAPLTAVLIDAQKQTQAYGTHQTDNTEAGKHAGEES